MSAAYVAIAQKPRPAPFELLGIGLGIVLQLADVSKRVSPPGPCRLQNGTRRDIAQMRPPGGGVSSLDGPSGPPTDTRNGCSPRVVGSGLGSRGSSRALVPGGRGLRGRLAAGVAWRWVGAGDTTVSHVLRPFRPRPVPLLMSAAGVGEPAGRDACECDLAGRPVDSIRSLAWRSGGGERAGGR